MASISEASWDGAASNYKDADSYCKACLIDENPSGEEKSKSACSYPVYTPDGALSRAGVHNAATRLNQSGASPAAKKVAANKLLSCYSELKEPAPKIVYHVAGKQPPKEAAG